MRSLVRAILENACGFVWTAQGFGMLRLHMGETRLHVWDERLRVTGVSMIHDHLQWGLLSTIISGRMTNQRYRMLDELTRRVPATHHYATITAGKAPSSAAFRHEPYVCALRPKPAENYGPGQQYLQQPDEIHESIPSHGCVTLMIKRPTSTDQARVFWPIGTEWGSAQPRSATKDEIIAATCLALEGM